MSWLERERNNYNEVEGFKCVRSLIGKRNKLLGTNHRVVVRKSCTLKAIEFFFLSTSSLNI